MSNFGKGIVAVVVFVLVVVLISSGKKTEMKADDKSPIKIGAVVALTGDAAVYGEPMRNIYELASAEINAAGGINGRPIEIIFEDTKCMGKEASNATSKLINVDKVQVIIGAFCSSEALASAPVASSSKVLFFSQGASNPGLTGISPYFFRNYPSDASQGKILAQAAFTDKGWKNVAFIQEQTDYATGVYKAFSDEFLPLGGKLTNESFPSPTMDFRTIITKIQAGKPDAVVIDTQTPAVAIRVLQQMSQLKWHPKIIINDAISGDPETMSKNAALLEGAITAEFGTDPTNEKFQHMLAVYKAKYGVEPPYQSYAQTEYDGLFMLRDGLLAVGYDGEKLAAWSRTIKDWQGASGNITILPSGDRDGGHVLRLIKEGKVVPYTK